MAVLALVDCNSFYAACEQAFRPDLLGRPVVVLSNNDGCVVARSKEAKALGIRMGEPWFQARQRLGEGGAVTALSSNYALYADMSRRVMRLLARFAPCQEIYSIDECFLDLTGLPEDPGALGRRLRDTVRRWTGLPVCVGIGPTKTLAKLANRLAKQDAGWEGVCDLGACAAADRDRWLAATPVAAVWGIGPRLASRLEALGMRSALDLAGADPRRLQRTFSVVVERTALELRGVPCLALEDLPPDRQQIQCSRSFGAPVTAPRELAEAVTTFVSRAAEKLRAQRSEAGAVSVMIRTNLFAADAPQYSNSLVVGLPEPSADTRILARAALRGLRRLYRPGFRYAKAGILLLALTPAARHQADLFTPDRSDRGERLMATLDRINRRYGRETILLAGAGLHRRWAMHQAYRSPRYTTRWDELPVARC